MMGLLPVAALLVPGIVAFVIGRRGGRARPGLTIAAVFAVLALWEVSKASGAAHDDATAMNRVLLAAMIWAPAAASALAGAVAARMFPKG